MECHTRLADVYHVEAVGHVDQIAEEQSDGAVARGGVVCCWGGIGRVGGAARRGGGHDKLPFAVGEGDGGLVEAAVDPFAQVDGLRPVAPVGKAGAGGHVDIAIAEAAGVGYKIERAHIAAQQRAAFAVGAVDGKAEVDGFAPFAVGKRDVIEVGGQGGVAMEIGPGLLDIVSARAVGSQQYAATVGQHGGVGLDKGGVDGLGQPLEGGPEGVVDNTGGPYIAADAKEDAVAAVEEAKGGDCSRCPLDGDYAGIMPALVAGGTTGKGHGAGWVTEVEPVAVGTDEGMAQAAVAEEERARGGAFGGKDGGKFVVFGGVQVLETDGEVLHAELRFGPLLAGYLPL